MAPFEPLSFQIAAQRTVTAPVGNPWLGRLPWIGLAVALHGALLILLALVPMPEPVQVPTPFAVEILSATPQEKVETPKPKPVVVKRPAPTPPIPVSKTPAPAALTTQAQPTPPAAEAPAAKTSNDAAPAAAQAVVQPRFDAAYLNNPAPTYPPLSRRMGETGRVFLRVHVQPSGSPDQVEIRTSSGFPRLDNAAQEAVKRWRFVPAKQGSELVAAWVVVPISFSLEN